MESDDFFNPSWTLFESRPNDNHDHNHDSFRRPEHVPDVNDTSSNIVPYRSVNTLAEAIEFLSLPFEKENLMLVEDVISKFMGSMAQSRIHGKEIKELGGISCLMTILSNVIYEWEGISSPCDQDSSSLALYDHNGIKNQRYCQELKVVTSIMGALRDLSCGDASIRLQIGQYHVVERNHSGFQGRTGVDVISYFIIRHALLPWDEIPLIELRNMTNALGVARNITHSTPYNCRAFHEAGMTKVFMNRLLGRVRVPQSSVDSGGPMEKVELCGSLPNSSKPWREACYRLAGTLINMGEKCHDAAVECAKDEHLIWILIESWGGVKDWDKYFLMGDLKKTIPVLHLGLYAILLEKMKMMQEMPTATATKNSFACEKPINTRITVSG